MQKSLVKKERAQIFKLFLDNTKFKFNEIEKHMQIRSNMVSYHLTSMLQDGILVKKGEYYVLTEHAEKYIPIFSDMFMTAVGPLPVVLVAILNKKQDKILLIKRNKRPYKNYWSMIGGKILLHEDFKDASIRKVKEKTGLDSEFLSLNDILHERVEGSGIVKHSFILIFTKVLAKRTDFNTTKAGELKWFSINQLDSDTIIPSDYHLIKCSLNKKFKMKNLYMNEDDGQISKHRFLE
jgi:ADP-ribose pyrophosphatase YjhB (NUDIX family)